MKEKDNLILNSNNYSKKIFLIFLVLINSILLEANSFNAFFKKEIPDQKSVEDLIKNKRLLKTILISDLDWRNLENSNSKSREIEWEEYNETYNNESSINENELFLPNKLNDSFEINIENKNYKYKNDPLKKVESINSLNRSIVFNEKVVGPDIGWLVPPGFVWTKKHKLDASIRGYNQSLNYKRRSDQGWGWNEGDAVGQFYYQFFNNENFSFGTNIGMRVFQMDMILQLEMDFQQGLEEITEYQIVQVLLLVLNSYYILME